MKKFNEIQIRHDKTKNVYTVNTNNKSSYAPFENEIEAKAAAFDEILKAQHERKEIKVSYIGF